MVPPPCPLAPAPSGSTFLFAAPAAWRRPWPNHIWGSHGHICTCSSQCWLFLFRLLSASVESGGGLRCRVPSPRTRQFSGEGWGGPISPSAEELLCWASLPSRRGLLPLCRRGFLALWLQLGVMLAEPPASLPVPSPFPSPTSPMPRGPPPPEANYTYYCY